MKILILVAVFLVIYLITRGVFDVSKKINFIKKGNSSNVVTKWNKKIVLIVLRSARLEFLAFGALVIIATIYLVFVRKP